MNSDLLKGETVMFINKIKKEKEKMRKVYSYTPVRVLVMSLIMIGILFFKYPTLKECKEYLLPGLTIILVLNIFWIGIRYFIQTIKRREIIKEGLLEHNRILKNIHEVYEDEKEMNAMMEVLVIGCDIKYKEDKQKINKVIQRIIKG